MKHLTTMEEAAALMLDQLERGEAVSLDIAAKDDSTAGLLGLIMEVHELATKRRIGVSIDKVGERTIRLTIAS